jgi:flagellar basal-body rod protein FlgG
MVRGFYELTSGMLTKDRQLAVIGNNVANVKTPGFKTDNLTDHTFGSMVINRLDSKATPLGGVTMIRSADTTETDYTAGNMEQTARTLDFAIQGNGFFAVQGQNGVVYTRNGSFNLDNEGYLTLSHVGRVLNQSGQPIRLGTDQITANALGNLSINDRVVDTIGIYDFADYKNLRTVGEGMFSGNNATLIQGPTLEWQYLESSNVNVGKEITKALDAQRTLQNCSQALKMYDQILQKATTEISKI